MNIVHAIVLGIVEGITEFLPISSTGHMILVAKLLAIEQSEFTKTFEIVIQLGAILAAVTIYFKLLISNRSLWPKLVVGFIPTAIIGFLLYKVVKNYFLGNSMITVIALFIGGIVFLLLERFLKTKKQQTLSIDAVSNTQAFFIGVGQSLSIIPGVSRAAASIFTGMLMGLSRECAVEFSFLLAVPTIVAASVLDIWKSKPSVESGFIIPLLVGTIAAYITATIAIKTFVSFVKKHSFVPFAIYRMILAGLFWFFILKP